MPDKVAGYLEVGRNESHEIVVNHPDLQPDANGVGHIVFSINQARNFARLLITHVAYAERESAHPEKGLLPTIKVYAMNDCDWYAAASLEDAKKCMAENFNFKTTPKGIAEMCEECGVTDPEELDDEDMSSRMFSVEQDDSNGHETTSFRGRLDQMIAAGDEFPCFFASTEY